ncbi:MAG: hypothetical protein C0404_10200 [Verrucomicrobia bacterium]|nr:hypothetical protein [Verrucomicrobiota bacterium]
MTIPSATRSILKQRLWDIADQLGWNNLGQADKARYYEVWTRDPVIGGVISRYMDGGQVRVYIKDTLLKDYGRVRMADPGPPLRSLGIDGQVASVEKYIKPHGRRLDDGRVLCWGRADDWKAILMAVHERAFYSDGEPFAAVFMSSCGKYHDAHSRAVVMDAAKKLGIERIVWLG